MADIDAVVVVILVESLSQVFVIQTTKSMHMHAECSGVYHIAKTKHTRTTKTKVFLKWSEVC